MLKFPWKSAIAGAAILAATVYAFAAQLVPGQGGTHERMMGDMGGMHGQMTQGISGGMHGQPAMPGQDAFGAIQEIVQILEADRTIDWSKVDIAALREHLIDMNEVTLHAVATERTIDNKLVIEVTGEGRTRDAIKRMVPAHVRELQSLGWNAGTDHLPNGVRLTVTAANTAGLTKLKALGFMGIMVQGGHHQPHHLMIAKGAFPNH